MIPFDGCIPAFLEIDQRRDEPESATFVCMGPAPFDADLAPCCDEHEEEWTRARAQLACCSREETLWLANTIGVHRNDMIAFVEGKASLTHPARKRVREVIG